MTRVPGRRRSPRARLPAELAPFADARFTWFFIGRSLSTFGSMMAPVALVFAVMAVDPSPVALGQVLAARSLPIVVLLLLGGVIADRFSRGLILMASHVMSGFTQGAVAWLVLTGQAELWQLIVLEALNGVSTAVSIPTIQGIVPDIVARDGFQQANALLAMARSGLAVLGPAVAAVLVVAHGPGWPLAIDALSWFLAAACMLPLATRRRVRSQSGFLTDLRSGWELVSSTRWLWVVIVAFGLLNIAYAGAWLTLGPTVARASPHLGAIGWGYAVSVQALGMLVASLILLRLRFSRPLVAGLVGVPFQAAPLVALAMGAPLPVLLAACLVSGIGMELFGITWQTAIYENVPASHMSRVMAYDTLGSFVAIPLGQVQAGPLADRFGVGSVLWSTAASVVVVGAATASVADVRRLRRGTPPGPGPVQGAGPSAPTTTQPAVEPAPEPAAAPSPAQSAGSSAPT